MDDVLRRAPLFRELDDEAAAALRASMVEVKLARGEVLFREGDEGDRVYVVIAGKIKLGGRRPTGARTCWPCWGRVRCSVNCRCSIPGRAAPPSRRLRTPRCSDSATPTFFLADRPPRSRTRPAVAIRAAVAAVQRHPRRSGLLRRARPSGQAAAGSVDPFRRRLRRRCSRRARSHPGRAGAACGSVARDRQQGARRLRRARMVAARAAFGRATRH